MRCETHHQDALSKIGAAHPGQGLTVAPVQRFVQLAQCRIITLSSRTNEMLTPMPTPDTQTLIGEIATLRALVEDAPQSLGEKITHLREACAAEGRVFRAALAAAGVREREAYRLIDSYAAITAFERLFGARPSAPSVIRPLRQYLTDDAMLKRIARALKAQGIAVGAATAADFARAVKVARPPAGLGRKGG